MIRALVERAIAMTRDGNRTFFDTARFPWIAGVEAEWMTVRAELDSLLRQRDRIPNFQDLSPDQAMLTEADHWKTYFFYAYGRRAERNCQRCPGTARLLERIPGMKTAMFSILAPGKRLPEHRGPWKGVLRYHLGLVVPSPDACGIRVGNDVRSWHEGASLVFDDAHPHEAWNDSDQQRVVLFVDFLRPLPFPLSLVNRVMVWRISRTPFVTDAMARIRAVDPGPVPPA